MSTSAWRPRFWIAGYDGWHVPLVVTWVALMVALTCLPARSRPVPIPRQKPSLPRHELAPTMLREPVSGTVFLGSYPFSASGTAEPGGIVRLYRGSQFLGETVCGRDGSFEFRVSGFPRGTLTLRAMGVRGGQTNWSAPVSVEVTSAPSEPRLKSKPKLKSRS